MPWFEQSSDVSGSRSTVAFLDASGIAYGTIGTAFDTDWYRMDMQAGVRYTVMLNALTTGFQGNLVLRDANGTALYTVAVPSGGSNGIFTTPAVSGTYYWDVEGIGTTGSYTLTATTTAVDDYAARAATTGRIAIGQPAVGTIETWSDHDWFQMSLTAGHTYYFSNAGGTLQDTFLSVFSREDGGRISWSSNGTLLYTPTQTGTYYLDVSSNSFHGTGTYQINAVEAPSISVPSPAVTQDANGNRGTTFTLTLSAPISYDITVQVDTKDETAIAGIDYQAVHQSVVIKAGSTTATVTVPMILSNDFLPARAFEFNLSNATGATISTNYYDPSGTYQGTAQPNSWGVVYERNPSPYGDLPTDTYFPLQWYLYTTRTVLAWKHATGAGVKIAEFDQGIDGNNPDLSHNDSVALGRTALNLSTGGAPVLTSDDHGTLVAGVIGAARDGQGVVGVAYDATLVPIYTSDSINQQYLTEIANAFSYAKNFDVLNDSWGFGNLLFSSTTWAFLDDAKNPGFAPAFQALQDLATNGRSGLGTIVVQSAGNSFQVGDDTNLHNFQNSRYIITVGSTDYFGSSSGFSTTGASILVSAPGGAGARNFDSILTTDRSGAAGENSGNVAFSDGTSFSAPIVSGVVALMLQANPHLGYRDVQQILAYTAHQTDVGVGSWANNGATDWNGGGLRYNAVAQSSGFGQVDALAAVRLAETWGTAPHTVANLVEATGAKTVSALIPDNNAIGISSTIQLSSPITVERVDVTVNITHPFIGDLQVTLLSPTGTASYLMYRPAQGSLSAYGSSQDDVHFTFDTVLDWGEAASGSWTLNVRDLASGDIGSFDSWSIDVMGRPSSNDHTFIYTNEFPTLVAADAKRGILSDPSGGIDTINTSALGSDDRIDLSGATNSIINGGNLQIAAGTVIRNAYGGEGNDTLVANAAGSLLYGMGGNDKITGAAGVDTAGYIGKNADYTITKNADGSTVITDNKGNDGTDTLVNVERLVFSDKRIAIDTDGRAGEAYRLYQAAFNRKPDLDGLGWQIKAMDAGTSLLQLAQNFMDSAEFKTLYGQSPSDTALVNLFYNNVLHRSPQQFETDFWVNIIDTQQQSRAEVLTNFSDSAENQAQVIGSIQHGIEYTYYA